MLISLTIWHRKRAKQEGTICGTVPSLGIDTAERRGRRIFFCVSNLLLGQDHRNRVLGRLARQLKQCMDLALWHTGILPNEPRKKIDDSEMFVVFLEYHLLGGIIFIPPKQLTAIPWNHVATGAGAHIHIVHKYKKRMDAKTIIENYKQSEHRIPPKG